MTGYKRDFRYALRMFRRTPVFSSIATAVLAVAIAVATAVFSLYNYLALQPVAGVQGSSRLASIGLARDSNEWINLSLNQFRQFEEMLTAPELITAVTWPSRQEVDAGGEMQEITIVGVTPGLMRGLGIPMLLGADLDAASGDPSVQNIVLSERIWRDQFGGRTGIVGEPITINEESFTVVGVVGGGYQGLRRGMQEDAWVPVEAHLMVFGPRMGGMAADQRRQLVVTFPALRMIVRLPTGVSVDRLQLELEAILPRVREQWSSVVTDQLMRLEAVPGTAVNPRSYMTLIRQSQLLVGGAILVLLVASLNLASFFLARGPARLQELKTRMAIGASRGDIMRQLFLEAGTLVTVATLAGTILHVWLRTLLLRVPPFVDMPPNSLQVETDWRVFVFIIVAAVVVALISGLLPAVRIAFQPSLSFTSPSTLGRNAGKLQPLLVLQVMVATFVVLAGTLFASEIRRLERVPVGFESLDVVVGQFGWEPGAMRRGIRFRMEAEQFQQAAADLKTRAEALPGVESFAIASFAPFVSVLSNPGLIDIVGAVEPLPEERRRAYRNNATPDFFRVLAPRFLHGRPFDGSNPNEIVVSRALARQLFGRDDVVGEQLQPAEGGALVQGGGFIMRQTQGSAPVPDIYTIIGVVEDMRYAGQEDEFPPMFYRLLTGGFFNNAYIARGTVDPAVLQPLVSELVYERFPPMIANPARPMSEAMYEALKSERARGRLAATAAGIALLLTMIGLYASMQHMVEARRSELALRKAIGAGDGVLVLMILKRAGAIVGLGVVVALIAMFFLVERAESLLFGLDVLGVAAWGISIIVVIGTGLLSAWLPAIRAGRVDPAIALRYE